MKKILYSIAFLIFVSFPFSVKAEFLPPSVPGSTELALAEQFTLNASQTLFTSVTGYEIHDNPYSVANRAGFVPVSGGQYFSAIDWEYQPLSSLDWQPAESLWDSNGNEVSFANAGLCTGSNSGQYTYFLYSTQTGEILNIGDTYQGSISTLNTNANSNFPQLCYQLQTFVGSVDDPDNDNPLAIYNATNVNSSKLEWLKELPTASYSYGVDPDKGAYGIFLACNVPGVVVNYSNSLGSSDDPHFAMNEGYQAYLSYYGYGSYTYGNFPLRVQNANRSFGGYNYTMIIPADGANSFAPVRMGMITGSIYNVPYNYVNNPDLSDVTFVEPVNSITDPVDVTKPVNYSYYIDRRVTNNITNNNNYDPSKDYAVNNYPIINNITYPDYSPVYNYYYDYSSSVNPGIGSDIGSIDPEDVTNGIPILTNLKKRFPFSIPFDIYNLISGLAVERQAPHFEWSLYLPVVDYTWEIDIDLSMWNTQASIFRTCFLILFIIALAMWAYNHFFGS